MSFLNDPGLLSLGWSPVLQFHFDELNQSHLSPFRILAEDKNVWRVLGPNGLFTNAVPSGKLRLKIENGFPKPAVGDWIACESSAGDHDALLTLDLLPRRTELVRRHPGTGGAQTIIANVDTLFIATSANEDFNIRRLERYLSAAIESGAKPVLLVTKVDLMKEDEIAQLQNHFPSEEILGVSVYNKAGLELLKPYLNSGQTVAIVGSSGVGKSTLTNFIMGEELQTTHDIRHGDGKGRHTTTRREFFQTPWGGWIADTPGMREFALVDQTEGLNAHFQDVSALEENCRFNDCQHKTEPGCAIQEALATGELPLERWNSFLKMKNEINYQLRKGNKQLQAEEKKKWKQIHKDMYARMKLRK